MSRRRPPREPAPETPPEAAPETPAQAERRRRGVLGWSLIGLAALALLAVLLVGAGRLAVLTPAGRDLVVSFVAGKKIGRYGRINVEGLSGDLFDDFTLERVTVTDREGVWLEAREVRVDWSYLPLIFRRFHADAIEADVIRLIRRPVVEPQIEPPGRQPLTIDIDAFDARVEFLEGFSEEYGRWTLSGGALLDRSGRREASLNAVSLSRPGDYLRGEFASAPDGGLFGATLNLQAFEARGGPIAGALGYSPDQPFVLTAHVRDGGFDALMRTGGYTPLRAEGRFTEEGGQGSGYIAFAGSELLAPFAERLGPSIRFGIGMVPVGGRQDQFGMSWIVRGDNINVRASGAVTRSGASVGPGIRLNVTTPSVSRLAGRDIAGAGALQGVWRGASRQWTFEGTADLQRAAIAGYALQRVSGPVRIRARDGQFDIEVEAAGAGGSGQGLLAGLIGGTPRAVLRATRFADSRLLVRRFDLDGAGLDIQATGSSGLTGGLRAQGAARIADVSRLRRQAGGGLDIEWRAAQAPRSGPWTLDFAAQGSRFSTGWGELDRLLGRSPRLTGAGALSEGRIAIQRAELSGAAGRLNARGLIGLAGADMRLALDWNARGPFGVGPIEIGGAATGRGALTGTFARPVLDLTADFAAVEAGPMSLSDLHMILTFRRNADASDGRITLTGDSQYGPARAFSLFRIADDGVRLTDLDVNAGGVVAQGDLALRGSAPSSADLTFEARPGAFLTAGAARGTVRLTEGSGDALALVDVTGQGVRFSGSSYVIRTLTLRGQGTLSRLPFTLNADVGGGLPASFNGSGVYSRVDRSQTITLDGAGRVREVAYQTRTPLVIALAGDGRVVRADLSLGGGVLDGELRQDEAGALLRANLRGVDLRSLSPDLVGRITADVDLRGTGEDLSGVINARLDDARSRDADDDMDIDANIRAELAGDRMRVNAEAADSGGVRSNASLDLPITASAAPFRLAVNRTEPMSGQVSLQGQIRSIWDLVLGGERSLSGLVDAEATLAGTINEPRADGYLNISQGRFEDGGTGLVLQDLQLRTRFDAEIARIVSFSATDGRDQDAGRVTGEGLLGMRQGAGSNLTLQLVDFRVVDTDLATARASGPIRVTRAADGAISLAGDLQVSEAQVSADDLPNTGNVVELDVIEINRPGGLEDEIEETDEQRAERRSRSAFNLNVRLRSPGGGVFVTGRGLDVELALDATVGGSLSEPVLTGEATVVRGDYQFGGRRFTFEQGGTITLSTQAERIRLRLRAVREDPALTAWIRVTGTAARPIITLGSSPELPQDEILSQVLFGRSASQLSPIEAAQLASSVASLAGGGGFDVVGNLREFAGLDRLSFGGDASSLTVAGGKYIGDDLYFEIIGGGEEGGAVQVEWRARRNISVVSRIGGDGQGRLYVRWRRQSGDGGRRAPLDPDD